jgi:peptidyl-prolyl cis-trans isomerase C
MKRALSAITIVLFLFAAAYGCAKKPSADDRVLARMSNKYITLGDFRKRIEKVPSYYRNMIDKNKKRFLDETIVEMMFYEEAIRQSLDRDKEVKQVLVEAKKKILIAKLIQKEVESKIKIEDSEARKFYEEHKEEFKSQELWRASHILVSTEKEAQDILGQISNGASFETLAREKSMDATATRGGDVGYFRQGQIIPAFEAACLKLKPGEVGPIIHTEFGYHVIKLTGKKEPSVEPYEKVKAKVIEELKKAKRSELFDRLVMDLKSRYKVEVEGDVFKSLELIDKEKEKAVK